MSPLMVQAGVYVVNKKHSDTTGRVGRVTGLLSRDGEHWFAETVWPWGKEHTNVKLLRVYSGATPK